MTEKEHTDISGGLATLLAAGTPAILLTVDESGFPHTAFTYAITTEAHRLAVAVDEATRTLANLERTGKASVQILGGGNIVYLLKGRVYVSSGRLTASPVPSRRAEIEIQSVKNQAWSGVAVEALAYHYLDPLQSQWQGALPFVLGELRHGDPMANRSGRKSLPDQPIETASP